MKNIIIMTSKFLKPFFALLFLTSSVLFSCSRNGIKFKNNEKAEVFLIPRAHSGTVNELIYVNSYMLASTMEKSMKNLVLNPDDAKFTKEEEESYLQGFIDYFSGIKLDEEYLGELDERILALKADLKRQKAELAQNYFNTLKEDEDVVKTSSGLLYRVINSGSGKKIESKDQRVNIDYTRNSFDNFSANKKKKIDSQESYEFTISTILPSILIDGMLLMREGDEYEFYIHHSLAGANAQMYGIEDDSFLIVDVKINQIL